MEVVEATAKSFSNVFPKPLHAFGSPDFIRLNETKAEAVYYLMFKDSKYRLGLIVGICEGIAKSPFSAPFGGFVFINQEVKIHHIDHALNALIKWAESKEIKEIRITLPPSLYHPSFIAKQLSSFYRTGFKIEEIDLNYSFHQQKLKKLNQNLVMQQVQILVLIWNEIILNYS